MINPNGDDFTKNDPQMGSGKLGDEQALPGTGPRFQTTTEKVSSAAGDAWRQTRERAGVARERTEFFLRENPVPTILGALAIGLAIGLAIRYSSESEEREVETKPLANVDLSVLTLPFLWPFFKSVKSRYEDTADVVRDRVGEGVDRLRKVDVDEYVKPLRKTVRKTWRSWTR